MSATNYIDPEIILDMNGVIEPLTIRSVVAFRSLCSPVEVHSVKGELCDGSVDIKRKTSSIISIKEFNTGSCKLSPFIDAQTCSKLTSSLSTGLTDAEYIELGRTDVSIVPFNDQSDHRLNKVDSESAHMKVQIQAMTGSTTETYISFESVSMPCGFSYDLYESISGTDSIAFGGLTYSPSRESRYSIY